MDFLALGNAEKSNEREVSVGKEEAMIGESKENSKDKQRASCTITGEAGSSSWMKLMADSNPATQLALSSGSGEESFKSKNLRRQQSGFGSVIPMLFAGLQQRQPDMEGLLQPLLRAAGSAVPEKQSGATAQLTIFYDGMVNVYDDLSADKAQAIMLLASSGNNGNFRSQPPPEKSVSLAIYNQPTRKVSDLPIARKQSLQRFLEKRQDRRHAKAPHAREENVKPSPHPHPTSSLPSLQAN
ncbi:hypothetical protein SUGI_0126500 [Cryptomeria japonica]|uniref:protein TIFY 10B isoform X2 n=1 Tax=Cryptomeria japonica TaxID=3369 RepID=UPI002408A04D|nr:protein TIFY 10B isoform X2 [Cryptomeria japonica]GLJ10342.1 hypothetical protein SUGI_0126500 [Cryptomeria japonica]